MAMKQVVCSELHDVETLDSSRTHELCRYLESAETVLRTYNRIMESAVCGGRQCSLGALVICPEDADHPVVFQHLALFCRHFGVRLLRLAKGSRTAVERAVGRSPAAMFGIPRTDPVCEDICRLAVLREDDASGSVVY